MLQLHNIVLWLFFCFFLIIIDSVFVFEPHIFCCIVFYGANYAAFYLIRQKILSGILL